MTLKLIWFLWLLWFSSQFHITTSFGSVKTVVVNGEAAKLGDVPYQISLKAMVGKKYSNFCGGSIVGPDKVLSAAHCFVKRGPGKQKAKFTKVHNIDKIFVVAGNLLNRDVQPQNETLDVGQWRRVLNLTYPQHFMFPKHDIAIVFIKGTWVFNVNVKAIGHAKRADSNTQETCQISGYGRTGMSLNEGTPSEILLKARVHMKSSKECNRIHRQEMDRYICTDGSIADVRQGDSGGPLACNNTGDPEEIKGLGVLVGIVSGSSQGNTFFLRVATYYNWIKRNGAERSNCSVAHPSNVMFVFVVTFIINTINRGIYFTKF